MNSTSTMDAEADLSATPGVAVARFTEAGYGSLEDAKLAQARRLLLGLVRQLDPLYLIIDLSRVDYIGAGFIGIVVAAWDELKKKDRQLVLCGLNPYCARLIHTLHLDRLFMIRPMPQAALEEIRTHLRAATGAVQTAPLRVQVSDVGWDPDLLRLEYLGDDSEPIRCVIVARRG